jgi:hypothetical protein
MGLLDDAIREHLDLKRRRGADPTEVEREEREVLGPVRRRGEPSPDDGLELELQPEDDLEHEPLAHDSFAWDDSHLEEPENGSPAGAFDHELEAPLGREPEPYLAPEPPEPYVPPAREPEPGLYDADIGHEPPPTGETTMEFNVEEVMEHEEVHPLPAESDPLRPEPDPLHREPDPLHPEPDPFHPEGNAEDVLEETPEFLQDTPDHDRLWFEQRPPRDFDFDG